MRILQPKQFLLVLGFVFQLTLLGLTMRLDPDPHHDGILYGAAVSVSNGGFPNRDAFAQYGPLVPEIQGIALRILGPSLVNIRLQALAVFILCSIAIWYVAQNYFSPLLAFVISSTWILALPSVLPWPNIYTTLIAIVSLLILVNISQRKLRSHPAAIIVSSALIGIGTFGRIQLLVIFVLVFTYLVVSPSQRHKIVFWLIGYFGSTLTVILVLFLNKSLSSFITQCITWPAKHYAGPEITKSYIIGFLWYPFIFMCLVAVVLVISFTYKTSQNVYISVLISTVIFLTCLILSRQARVGNLTLLNPRIFAIDFANNMLNSVNYFAAFLSILLLPFLLIFLHKVKPVIAISILYSSGILTQLYPLYDLNHLWLISPILIIGCLITLGDLRLLSKNLCSSLTLTFIGLCVVLIAKLSIFISVPRIAFESPSLKGMYAPQAFANQLDETMRSLSIFSAPGSTTFDCKNGLYAGASGKYLASSSAFVNWGPQTEPTKMTRLYFFCGIDEREISERVGSGYLVVFKTPLIYFGSSAPSGLWNVLLQTPN